MLGFEPQISGVGSDSSTSWATTTSHRTVFCSEILADFPAINNILGAGGFECRPLHKDQFSWYILFVMEIINGIAEICTLRQLGEKRKRYLCATQSHHQSTNKKVGKYGRTKRLRDLKPAGNKLFQLWAILGRFEFFRNFCNKTWIWFESLNTVGAAFSLSQIFFEEASNQCQWNLWSWLKGAARRGSSNWIHFLSRSELGVPIHLPLSLYKLCPLYICM